MSVATAPKVDKVGDVDGISSATFSPCFVRSALRAVVRFSVPASNAMDVPGPRKPSGLRISASFSDPPTACMNAVWSMAGESARRMAGLSNGG